MTKNKETEAIRNAPNNEAAIKIMFQCLRNLDPVDAALEIATCFADIAKDKRSIKDCLKMYDLMLKVRNEELVLEKKET